MKRLKKYIRSKSLEDRLTICCNLKNMFCLGMIADFIYGILLSGDLESMGMATSTITMHTIIAAAVMLVCMIFAENLQMIEDMLEERIERIERLEEERGIMYETQAR